MFVFVLNRDGRPLMPCKPRKARLLLKTGKAQVVRMEPFTIQLLFGSSGYTQDVSLGVDAGTKHIGVSATTEKDVLFEAEVQLRTDIQELLATRAQLRRVRRSRKTRYRKARFLNRKKREGWIAPSVRNKVESHVKLLHFVHALLPVKNITIEVAQFDIQKIKNPAIQNKEYQEGPLLDFWNTREYVLFRDFHLCQWCKGKSKDAILNVHHIESRKTGGDSPANLITLCETCHKHIHEMQQEGKIQRGSRSFRDASHMSMMRWKMYEEATSLYAGVKLTYGYLTKKTRIESKLEKSHGADARCISKNPLAQTDGTHYLLKYVRRNNRQLHKTTIRKGGVRQRNTAPKYVHDFRLFDCVKYEGRPCFIFGRRNSGYFDLRTLGGTKIHASASYKKLVRVQRASSCLVERRGSNSSLA
jgi:5-methylcytosine-specific restriction endonuclease McrA